MTLLLSGSVPPRTRCDTAMRAALKNLFLPNKPQKHLKIQGRSPQVHWATGAPGRPVEPRSRDKENDEIAIIPVMYLKIQDHTFGFGA